MASLHRLLLWTIGLTAALIVLGGAVRATGAGLACPDWPLCHGRLIPPLQGLVLIEYGHRVTASVVGLLTLLVVVRLWRLPRGDGALRRLGVAAGVLLLAQVLLGGLTVKTALTPALVAAHLGTAMLFLSTLLLIRGGLPARGGDRDAAGDRDAGGDRRERPAFPAARSDTLRVLAPAAVALVLAQIVLGGYVASSGAALACPDLPLCRGQLWPAEGGVVLIHFLHRLGALAVAAVVGALWWLARGGPPATRRMAGAAVLAAVLQIGLGMLNIVTRVAGPVTVLHLAGATALLGILVALWALLRRASVPAAERAGPAPHATAGPEAAGLRAAAGDYLALTKPRIILLLLATTVTSMVLAAGSTLSLRVVAYTLLGGALAAGAANAINMYWDRDVDSVMARTRRRPVPAGRISARRALLFGLLLAALSVAVFAGLVNRLAAALALAGILFYVFVYTIWLKRATPQNIVIGGAAGAVPPLVGWAAVTGGVALPAFVLFAIVFLWTPPHFWALALYRRADYAAAGIPMLPVVAGEGETRRQIVRYSVALVAVSLLLVPFGGAGPLYLAAALVLGGIFIHLAWALGREQTRGAVRLFGYSVIYLALLFAVLAVDRLL